MKASELQSITPKEFCDIVGWDDYTIENNTIVLNSAASLNSYGNDPTHPLINGAIPFKLEMLDGHFTVENCVNITSLRNMPDSLPGNFQIINLPNLQRLEYFPKICNDVNLEKCGITSLQGLPEKIIGHLQLSNLPKLKSFKYFPKRVGYRVFLHDLPQLTPWDLRYLLFSSIAEDSRMWQHAISVNKNIELKDFINDYFMLRSENERQQAITSVLEKLKELTKQGVTL